MSITNTAPTSLIKSHSRLFATVDHCLNSVKDEILAILRERGIETLPEDPGDLEDLKYEPGLAELIRLYCFCELADQDLDDGGFSEVPETYEHFRQEVLPNKRGAA